MRRMLVRFLALLIFASAARGDEHTLMSWDGVEVITNDFDIIGRVRNAARLPPRTLLDFTDPAFPTVCKRVQEELAFSKVVCTNLIGARLAPEGPYTAVYIVELDMPDRKPRVCPSGDSLPEALMSALESGYPERADVVDGSVVREFVNEKNYLDYDDAGLSAHAARLHAATQHYKDELAAAVGSCEPSLRMSAFDLLRFVGEPQRFTGLAGDHINDWDLGVAQAANGFLVTFAEFVPAAQIPALANEACKGLREGGFFVRSNSLMLLNSWRKSKQLSFSQLAAGCQRQVHEIARTSIATQIAVPARELVNQPAQ
ncbi:MAG TPA: hypothetical protein VH814_24955 [Steroidobacteraceae bacterium]|jgi:hypothetical protein